MKAQVKSARPGPFGMLDARVARRHGCGRRLSRGRLDGCCHGVGLVRSRRGLVIGRRQILGFLRSQHLSEQGPVVRRLSGLAPLARRFCLALVYPPPVSCSVGTGRRRTYGYTAMEARCVHHPVVGRLELNFESLDLSTDPGLQLNIYTAPAGGQAAERLALLASWAGLEPLANGVHAPGA